MMGLGLTMDFPDELLDYLPHIVGDLRGGGFTVDVITYQPTRQGVGVSLFLTW